CRNGSNANCIGVNLASDIFNPLGQGRTDHLETWALPEGPGSVGGRGGLTIWKLGHCPRARGQ
ncbi:unnamed protein product, partial [Staurois parvus]